MNIIAEIILVTLIIMTFKGLQLSNAVIIDAIENAPQARLVQRSVLTIGALFFLQWQIPGFLGAAELGRVSLVLYIIIIYEVIGVLALLSFREGYVGVLKQIDQGFSLILKVPVVVELLFFCYLFVKHIIFTWGFLFW